MKTFKPAPVPAPEESPEQAPSTPERQPRRRTTVPTFARVIVGTPTKGTIVAIAFALFSMGAMAQTTPSTTPATPGTVQQPTTSTQRGWVMFDDRVGKEMQLQPDQLQRLRDVDMRYQKDYTALGAEPWTNQGYSTLTDRRATDVRGILTPTQYEQWSTKYNTAPLPPPPPGDLRPGTTPR